MRRWEIRNRLLIQDLIVRYCIAIDDRDLEAIGALFHPEATFSAVGVPPRGTREIVEYYRMRLAAYGMTYHYPHGVAFSHVGKHTAEGIVLAHAELSINGELFQVAMRYYDKYLMHNGVWTFQRRELKQFYALPQDELAKGVGLDRRVRWPRSEPVSALLPESLDTWIAWSNTVLS